MPLEHIEHGSHRDWKSGKTWKNGKAFSSQGKVREFCQDWKSQGILPKILEKQENLKHGNVMSKFTLTKHQHKAEILGH